MTVSKPDIRRSILYAAEHGVEGVPAASGQGVRAPSSTKSGAYKTVKASEHAAVQGSQSQR